MDECPPPLSRLVDPFPDPQHGADPSRKNRDGNSPLDLVRDGDTDIQDLLRGDAALLDAAKKGCLGRVRRICSPANVNCRDAQGRHSTPLHLAGRRRTHARTHAHTFVKHCCSLNTQMQCINVISKHCLCVCSSWLQQHGGG